MPAVSAKASSQQIGGLGEWLVEKWMCAEGFVVLARNRRWGGVEWDRIVASSSPQHDLFFCEIKLLAWTAGPSFSDWVKMWTSSTQFRRQQKALLRLEKACTARGYRLQRHLLICVNRSACCLQTKPPVSVVRRPNPHHRLRSQGDPVVAFDLISGHDWCFSRRVQDSAPLRAPPDTPDLRQ